jgi:GT2 family glycosyltransferase
LIIGPKVSIIIVFYSNALQLLKCIRSIFDSEYDNFEIILVMNGSKELVEDHIKDMWFNKIIVQINEQNLGFAKACNKALQLASGKYIFILNDDTVVRPRCLTELVKFAELHSETGALQPKLLSLTNPSFFEYNGAAGGFMDVSGTPFCRGRLFVTAENDIGQYDKPAEIFWASGACMFVRRDVVRKIGLFDESFVQHMEEIDLCWRILLYGFRIYSVPAAEVLHVGGAASLSRKFYWKQRNNLFTMVKNLGLPLLVIAMFQRFVLDMGNLIVSARHKQSKKVKEIIQAYVDFLRSFRIPWIQHLKINKLKRTSDKEILSKLLSKNCAIQYFLLGRNAFWKLGSLPQPLWAYAKIPVLTHRINEIKFEKVDQSI